MERARLLAKKPEDPKQCYRAWHDQFGDVDPVLFRKSKGAWDALEAALSEDGARAAGLVPYQSLIKSLRPGATRKRCDEMARHITRLAALTMDPSDDLDDDEFDGVVMHASLAMIYRMHDGQDVVNPRGHTRPNGMPLDQMLVEMPMGLFGGLCVYDDFVNLRFLSLDEAYEVHTSLIEENPRNVTFLPVAVDIGGAGMTCVSVITGNVISFSLSGSGEYLRRKGAPEGLKADSWFAEYAWRLARGIYRVETFNPPWADNMNNPPACWIISKFPREPLSHATALSVACPSDESVTERTGERTVYGEVTRGVRIRVSTFLLPSTAPDNTPLFAYEIRMDLLGVQDQENRGITPMTSVQLKSRKWTITNHLGQVQEVEGEAVIGMYPLLRAGASEPFVYASLTSCTTPGTMGGGFWFVEGAIESPIGEPFFVRCPTFKLEMAKYIY